MSATGATDLVIDVLGYYTSGDPAAGGSVPVPERRLVDTRNGTGLPATPLASGNTTTVQVSGVPLRHLVGPDEVERGGYRW